MSPLLADILIFGGCALAAFIIGCATEVLHGYLDERQEHR